MAAVARVQRKIAQENPSGAVSATGKYKSAANIFFSTRYRNPYPGPSAGGPVVHVKKANDLAEVQGYDYDPNAFANRPISGSGFESGAWHM